MCVEQVQPYVEGMEIRTPEAENENISESTINGTANQAQKVPEMAAAEAQSEVSVVAAQLQIGAVMELLNSCQHKIHRAMSILIWPSAAPSQN